MIFGFIIYRYFFYLSMHQERKEKKKGRCLFKPSMKCIRNLKLRIMDFFFFPSSWKASLQEGEKKSIQIISFSPTYKITEVKVSLLLLFF